MTETLTFNSLLGPLSGPVTSRRGEMVLALLPTPLGYQWFGPKDNISIAVDE
jgi:hypothetical protein